MAVVQNLEDLVTRLLDCIASQPGCDAVWNEVGESMNSLAASQPAILLTSAHAFLLKNPKIPSSSRAFILRSIGSVADNRKVLEALDQQLLLLIINLATQEMTMAKDTESEWAEAGREVLVRIASSRKLVHFVLDALLQKFPPGQSIGPHKYIVTTLGAVAQHNASGFVPFLTDILSRTSPLLPHVKTEQARCAWARAICAFCEAVRECEVKRSLRENGDGDHGEDDDDEIDHNAPLEEVHRATYADQAEATYDVVFAWMAAKDPRVRAEAADCVGELCTMLNKKKVTEDIRKLITGMMGLYKRATADQYHLITQGICRLLECTCGDDAAPIDPYLDDLLNALFPHACLDADDVTASPNPLAIKNHSEAFRCFHVLASRFADRLVYYLLHKMQHVQDMQKLGAINVLRHLLNASGIYMDDKRSLVMMGLRKLLASEHAVSSSRVCRAMVQLCVALADHAFIDTDGGENVIAFLVRNLVVSAEGEGTSGRRVEADVAGINQLRTQCAQALHTISATCVCANKLLWPYLFEFLCVEKYTPVMADLCKCLRILIQREKSAGREPDYVTGFDNQKVAGRFAVFSRLFAMQANAPLNGLLARRSRESLALLKGAAPWFHPAAAETIVRKAEQMEVLIDDLTGASTSAAIVSPSEGTASGRERRVARVARWHDSVLSSLEAMVSSVAEGEWRQEIAAAMGKQLDLYSSAPEEKSMLYRCLGVVLSKISNQQFVTEHMMLMFRSASHASAMERAGVARGVGAIGRVHTDLALMELENVAKWEHAKKSTGFFGFIKSSTTTDTEMVSLRATLMLSYGHLVQACPVDTVCQRVEQTIIVFLRHYMANQKQETLVREALLETMHLMAVAVHPSTLGLEYTFPVRNELIDYIKSYVATESSETLSSALRLLACKAASALVGLDPPLSEKETKDLASCLTAAVLPISREKSGLKTLMFELEWLTSSTAALLPSSASSSSLSSSFVGGPRGMRRMEDDESATTMDATVAQYTATLVALVAASPTVGTVTTLLKILLPFYHSTADHERSRAVDATVTVLKTYYEHASDIRLGVASEFSPLSSLLGRLTPRLVDSLASVRLQALNALYHALRLAHAHKGHGLDSSITIVDVAAFVSEFLSEEGKMDGQMAKRTIKRFAEVIEARLPQTQVQSYLSALFDMLKDRQSQVSAGAAQLLTHILSNRGSTLHAEAETLVANLLSRLSEVHSCVQTYSDVLAALVAFASHQQVIVTDVLLKQPLPYARELTDAWECICRERSLYPSLLEYILELLVTALEDPHEVVETGAGNSAKVVRPELCAYAAALQEVVKAGDIEGGSTACAPSERIAPVLVALIQLLVSVADTQFPVVVGHNEPLIVTPELRRSAEKPSGLASAAIRTLLERTHAQEVMEEMNGARAFTECLDPQLHINAISTLLRSLAEHRPSWVDPVVRGLQSKEASAKEPLRAAAIAVIAAIVSKSPSSDGHFNVELFDDCVLSLQRALKDTSLRIRKLSIRGMGELADCGSGERAAMYASTCVDAAMEGLDDVGDRNDQVATESIVSLNKLVGGASDSQLKSITPQLLLKVRPCFDKESPFLRGAAFRLFGELSSRVGAKGEMDFAGHLHTNIIIVALHMNEEDEEVKKACGKCMMQMCPLFPWHLPSGVAQVHIAPDGRCSNYSQFTKELCLALSSSFPDKVNQYALTMANYYKSPHRRIRAAAAQLTGHLLGCLTPDIRSTISRDLIFGDLVLLLKDPEDVAVRVATARAIASLHAYV